MLRMYEAGAVCDADRCAARPGSLAVRDRRIVAAGDPAEVRRLAGEPDDRVELADWLLVPGLVNAHAHLELTDLGPRPYSGDFIEWVGLIMAERPVDDGARRAAIARGAAESRAAGVVRVGDIAASPEPQAMRKHDLGGVSFGELFGLGPPFDEPALSAIARTPAEPMLGWQPHAPYSAGPAVYAAAAAADAPRSTHLAETSAELRFVADATGPFRALLERIGKWDDRFAEHYGRGLSPVQWLRPHLEAADWLCAHCNYVDDADIETLAAAGASVAYCPRASEYFGHCGHRYRAMLDAGVNVCLGTDSIVCHGSMSILDEMRRLHQRDGTDGQTLLAMATVNGAAALGATRRAATFAVGQTPGVVGLRFDPDASEDALAQVLRRDRPPEIRLLEEAA